MHFFSLAFRAAAWAAIAAAAQMLLLWPVQNSVRCSFSCTIFLIITLFLAGSNIFGWQQKNGFRWYLFSHSLSPAACCRCWPRYRCLIGEYEKYLIINKTFVADWFSFSRSIFFFFSVFVYHFAVVVIRCGTDFLETMARRIDIYVFR